MSGLLSSASPLSPTPIIHRDVDAPTAPSAKSIGAGLLAGTPRPPCVTKSSAPQPHTPVRRTAQGGSHPIGYSAAGSPALQVVDALYQLQNAEIAKLAAQAAKATTRFEKASSAAENGIIRQALAGTTTKAGSNAMPDSTVANEALRLLALVANQTLYDRLHEVEHDRMQRASGADNAFRQLRGDSDASQEAKDEAQALADFTLQRWNETLRILTEARDNFMKLERRQ
jgi:hypothetical protein